ncbi:PP2C family serine/threonine-protein phosphatase [Methylomonas sp. AM2-LC]|uniref:PP2C family serine/threonine-protein phosphatase n=1 Tax=Methylomonas sp. AM2-LC TaxID=3153301 RepID=UPI003267DA91
MVSWHILAESVLGASHIRSNLPNQDAVAYYQPVEGELPLIVAVADGHGNALCTHSHLGAKFAVQVAIESVKTVLIDSHDLSLSQTLTLTEALPKTISRSWYNKVDCYINDNPEAALNNSEYLPFGTTLLVVCILKDCILYWQIGDGDIAIINEDNSIISPIPYDERLLGNDTTSLCNNNAWEDFRYAFLPLINTVPKAIFLVSDGYKNSFKYSEGFHQALSDINDFIHTESAVWVKQELAGWLDEASQLGSGDDITLAIIYSSDGQ